MSGEDPHDYGPVCADFRQKCMECGKQNQWVNGQQVEPKCGHDLPSFTLEVGGDE